MEVCLALVGFEGCVVEEEVGVVDLEFVVGGGEGEGDVDVYGFFFFVKSP